MQPSAPRKTAASDRILCALLFAAAVALLWPGIDCTLPHRGEPDRHLVVAARRLASGEEGGVSLRKYPLLLPMLLVPFVEGLPDPPPSDAPLEAHLRAAAEPVVRARLALSLLAALSVPLTYLLARRFAGRLPAIGAAALVLFSPLHLLLSIQARPHAAFAAASAFTLLCALRLLERPNGARTLFLGLACALGIATLQFGVLLLVPAALAGHFAFRSLPLGRRVAHAASLVCIPLLGLLAWPWLTEGALLGAHLSSQTRWSPASLAALPARWLAVDPGTFLAATVGLSAGAVEAWRRRAMPGPAARIVLALGLAHAGTVGGALQTQERFLLPLVVPAAVAAAATPPRFLRRLLPLFALLVAVESAGAVRFAVLRTRPDTFERAAEFVGRQAPNGGVIRFDERTSLPLLFAANDRPPPLRSEWERYLARLDLRSRRGVFVGRLWRLADLSSSRRAADLSKAKARLLDTPGAWVALAGTPARPRTALALEALREVGAEPLGIFRGAPSVAGVDPARTGYDDRIPLARFLLGEALGPELRLFRLARRTPGARTAPPNDGSRR